MTRDSAFLLIARAEGLIIGLSMICSRDTIFAAKLTPDLSPSISSHGAQLSNPAWQYVHQIEDIHTHIHTHARYGTVLAAQAFPTKDGHQLTPYRRSRRIVLWHCLGTSTMVRCAMCNERYNVKERNPVTNRLGAPCPKIPNDDNV